MCGGFRTARLCHHLRGEAKDYVNQLGLGVSYGTRILKLKELFD